MGQSTSELRHEIEQTRAEMGGTIDALADRTSPKRIVDRGRSRMRTGMRERTRGMREAVMGTADRVGDTAGDAPERARRQTQGNPLAAGAIAFGGGLLAASILPTTRTEQEMAGRVREEAQPALDELRQAGEHVRDEVKESAKQSAEEVRDEAKHSAEEVRDEAKRSAEDMRGEAQESAQRVSDQARGPGRTS